MLADIRYAWRALARSPIPSAAAVLSIALGIGANTAIFSAANALLLRSLPAGDPSRLVAIHATAKTVCCTEHSYAGWREMRDAGVFADIEAHYPLLRVSLAGAGEPERAWGQVVTENYFEVIQAHAMLGRTFTQDDARPGAYHDVAVLSQALWQRRFGGDATVVGRDLTMNNHRFTIIGVMPAAFRGTDLGLAPEFWVPFGAIADVMPLRPPLDDRTTPWLMINARLKPGISRVETQAALNVFARRMELVHPATDRDRGYLVEPAGTFHPAYRGALFGLLALAAVIAGLVLLVACVNVANILLARATARHKEVAIRLALGATRADLARQTVAESLILALAGAGAGLLFAAWCARTLASIRLPIAVPIDVRMPLDLRVLGFAFALAAVTGILFGLAPALRASHENLIPALKNGTDAVRRNARVSARDLLAAGQIAMSVLVLIAACLLFRSLANAWAIDPGFRARGVLLMSLDPRLAGYSGAASKAVMLRIREQVAALPGVAAASVTDVVPLGLGARTVAVRSGDRESIRADAFLAGPEYFEALGLDVRQGRGFHAGAEGSGPVAVVNERLAERLWPGQDAVGQVVTRGAVVYRVVGVARNVKSRTIGEEFRPCLYQSFDQDYPRDATPFGLVLVVRTRGDAASLAPAVRARIRAVEPSLAIADVRTMEDQIENALFLPRLGAILFGAFGAVALALTSVGLYGVIAYSVALRGREFGIRVAIGAAPRDMLRLVLRHGAALAGAGTAAGLAAAFAVARLMGSVLYGVSSTDALVFTAVPVLITTVSLLAAGIPALRASRVHPLDALRAH